MPSLNQIQKWVLGFPWNTTLNFFFFSKSNNHIKTNVIAKTKPYSQNTNKKKHTKKKPKKIRKTLGHDGVPKSKTGERERERQRNLRSKNDKVLRRKIEYLRHSGLRMATISYDCFRDYLHDSGQRICFSTGLQICFMNEWVSEFESEFQRAVRMGVQLSQCLNFEIL